MNWAALPASTAEAAKIVLLDAAGVMLGASGLTEEVRPFVRMAAAMGPGPCTVAGTTARASLPMAALANGALAHALDYEDAFDKAPGHPNASLVPALIALAQAEAPVYGRRFLPALAVGVESPALIMVRSVVTLADQLAWFGQGGAADAALASA